MKKHGLQELTNDELLKELDTLSLRETNATAQVLLHLAEVERRGIVLELGYASTFDYCLKHLGYAEPSAYRRIACARAAAKYPKAYHLFVEKRINLATLSLVSKILTEDNKDLVLDKIANKSKRQVEALVVQLQPKAWTKNTRRERIKPVRAALTQKAVKSNLAGELFKNSEPKECSTFPGQSSDKNSRKTNRFRAVVKAAQRFRFEFEAGDEFKQLLEQAQILLAGKFGNKLNLETTFQAVLEEYVQRHHPVARAKRRMKRAFRIQTKTTSNRKPRASLRDEVFIRDGGGCSYVGKNGRRCGSTKNLQIDHIRPWGMGGETFANNLRLLCAAHNRAAAIHAYGKDCMNQFLSR